MAMNIERAKTIEGFTNDRELEWLAKQASTRKRIVEVGSWKGRSTVAMAENIAPGGVLFAVDTWQGSDEITHHLELEDKPSDWLLQTFLANVGRDLIASSTVLPLAAPSLEIAKKFNGEKFDMIFIDAAHDYENVKADILAWRPLLERGGLLCGHDFDGGRPGVVKAVRELIPNVRMAGAGSIWYAG